MRIILPKLIRNNKKELLVIASFFIMSMAGATNRYVNDGSLTGDVFTTAIGSDANPGTAGAPYATIQFAINQSSAGDIIYVDAGAYPSGDISVTVSVTLRGAKFGIAAGPDDVPAGRGTDESIITGSIYYAASTDNIAVDGFTINSGSALRGLVARGLNSVVINNIITGIVTPFAQQQGLATRANAPVRLQSYIISYNNVRGFRYGIYMDGALENPSEISYNYVTGSSSAGYLFTASNGHHIKANVSENNGTGMIFTEGSNLIEQNTIFNNINIGIRMAATALLANNNIQYNFLTNNGAGIALTEDNAGAINNVAHFNSITGNTLSISNGHTALFDAQCNWYGTTDASIIAAGITGTVTFNPFLTDGTDTDPVLDGFQPAATCTIVPVILRDFSASVHNYDVLLHWQTASEVNSSHFVIERSFDNTHFQEIGRVAAKGYSDVVADYNFTDNNPENFNHPAFFRLAMVDRDGTKKYSRIVVVVLKLNSTVLNIYPNPVCAGGMTHVRLFSNGSGNASVSLFNSVGQLLNNNVKHLNDGVNIVDHGIPASIKPGMYYLLIRGLDSIETIPVQIN